jgi:FkbM family methyltransferase
MTSAFDPLVELLHPDRLTAIVDIGANPLNSDGAPPYKQMLDKRLCTVVGFEPQPNVIGSLDARKSDLETYLPYAIGDGSKATLKICAARGMSSLLTPDPAHLSCFPGFIDYGKVIQEIPVETRALDSIVEIDALDLLKIDVQGEELTVFRNGSARLSGTVALQTEVSFVPLYKHQPVFGDIDLALRALGFIPHMFANINKRMILPLRFNDQPFGAMNQLLEADIVYVRDFTQPNSMSAEQLKHLALIAHHCYSSYDLAAKCIHELSARGSLPPDSVGRYLAQLKAALMAA